VDPRKPESTEACEWTVVAPATGPRAVVDRPVLPTGGRNRKRQGHPGVTFGFHICRDNNEGKSYAEGEYEPIARIFERTLFQRFLLEHDDQRSGGFEPLPHLTEDRTLVLGLVSTKTPRMGSEEELRRCRPLATPPDEVSGAAQGR
jgi:hypothetical protein